MTEQLIPELVVPDTEIDAVLAWLKSEQTRIINDDRRVAVFGNDRLDWITDLHSSLRQMKEIAQRDRKHVADHNDGVRRRSQRKDA